MKHYFSANPVKMLVEMQSWNLMELYETNCWRTSAPPFIALLSVLNTLKVFEVLSANPSLFLGFIQALGQAKPQ
jgi:hypothetical protein